MSPTVDGVVFPIDSATELPAIAGGKALGLRDIVRAGLPIPPAWVVLPGATNGALSALAASMKARGIERVAVRSSAADEDGARHSFAGVHETALGVEIERLGTAVAAVAESPHAERALAYRRQRGLPPPSGPCAVVVQEMLDAEWAGVAFGRGDGVLVEAVEGLGQVAVNGDATPELIELARDGAEWQVVRRWPRRQPEALRVASGGVGRVTLTGARPELPERFAAAIAAGVSALERAHGSSLDVEWAARGDAIAFLQARPQTRPLEAALVAGETWTRTNVSETLPEVASAISRSIGVGVLDRVTREVHARVGLPIPNEIPLVASVAGRVVYNERGFFHVADVLGVPRSWARVLQGGTGAATNAYVRPDARKVLRRLDVLVRLIFLTMGVERKARAHIRELRTRYEARVAIPPSALDDEALLARASLSHEACESLHVIMRVAIAFQQVVSAGAMALEAHPAPAALLARLLDPELVSVSTRQLEDLVELARELRAWDGGARFLSAIGPEHRERGEWQARLPADTWRRVEEWLDRYGHRGPYESDVASPRFADDLRLLATALQPLVVAAREPETETRRARRRADAEAAWREVAGVHGKLVRLRVRGPARKLGRLMLVREELRSELMRLYLVARRDVIELGRRLAARALLDQPDDAFHLAAEELERAVREPTFDARSAVERERARIAAWRRLEVPNTFTSEEVASFQRRGSAKTGADTLLRGTAVSPGEVEACACILRSPQDEQKMKLGGILVAPSTDPGWTPIFARAAGMVVELGGVMSHAATVAREYGLPCVSNVDGATGRLRDGDLLRIDGTHGTVEILERADRK